MQFAKWESSFSSGGEESIRCQWSPECDSIPTCLSCQSPQPGGAHWQPTWTVVLKLQEQEQWAKALRTQTTWVEHMHMLNLDMMDSFLHTSVCPKLFCNTHTHKFGRSRLSKICLVNLFRPASVHWRLKQEATTRWEMFFSKSNNFVNQGKPCYITKIEPSKLDTFTVI